jgi:DNA-binding CsgD family transcriptional regulator/GTPase SAR1 family protein
MFSLLGRVHAGNIRHVRLTERDRELEALTARAEEARGGRGGVVVVCGESGAGKTSFVETFLERWPDGERVLWGACDPLATPRPLGPIHDVAAQLEPATRKALGSSDHPYEIFAAVFEELATQPSVLVIDDLHWADQATVDLLRFVLRRIRRTQSIVVVTVRDDEIASTHPTRSLLGDVARSPSATSIALPPLSVGAITQLAHDRPVDPVWLHRITGGNAFFVVEMLDHRGDDLPTTVRDAILARTVDLDIAAWDLLHLLAAAPAAIPDYLLADLRVTVPALRSLDEAKLIRRSDRGVTFRHDLCRLSISSVIPPGAEVELHRRMIHAYEATSRADPAILTHHALGAGDCERIQRAATEAGKAATRSGAHTQAAEFYRIALDGGGQLPPDSEAELLELLAAEYYLTDRLDDAIAACRRAMNLRRQMGASASVSANHHALSVYEWYNANRTAAERHATQAAAVLDGHEQHDSPTELAQLGHAFAMQAFLAVQTTDIEHAAALASRARQIADIASDPSLVVRVGLIDGYLAVLGGKDVGREAILSIVRSDPENFDEILSSGYSNLTYLDVEQRRLEQAADLLDESIAMTIERDLPICCAWQLGSRGRLQMLAGDWDDAVADADTVLNAPSAPLARTWPLLVRALISMRRDGKGIDGIDDAWRLASRYGEPLRVLPAAAAIAESAWLSGTSDDRLDECRRLLDSGPVTGLEWARGELAIWLHRLEPSVQADGVAHPYRLLLDGRFELAADEFHRLSTPYDAALALVDSGEADLARRGLDVLDRLGAAAVAAKIRRDLRSRGLAVVPARRRSTTLANPAGLTSRQIEVLRLIGEGLTNAELAERLYLSAKTVDHHVSAILAKLDVPGRRDAIRRGRELGILA